MSQPETGYQRSGGNGSGGNHCDDKKSSRRRKSRNSRCSKQKNPTVVTNSNSRPQLYRSPPPPINTLEAAGIPLWFKNYMDMFQKQVIADITRNIMDNLDASLYDEETRARHKNSYLALKRRYHILEQKLAQVRAQNIVLNDHLQKVPISNNSQHFSDKCSLGNHNNELDQMENVESKKNIDLLKNKNRKKKNKKKKTIERTITGECLKNSVENKKSLDVKVQNNNKKKPELLDGEASEKKSLGTNKNNIKQTKNIKSNEYSNNQINKNKKKKDKKKKKNDVCDHQNNNEIEANDCKKNLIENKSFSDADIAYGHYDEEMIKSQELQADECRMTSLGNKMQNVFMALRMDNLQALEEEVAKFVNLTEEDMINLIEFSFSITKKVPQFSDFLAAFIQRIADLNLENINLDEIIVSICDKDFEEKFYDRVLLMESLFDRDLIPEFFLLKIYHHYLSEEKRNIRRKKKHSKKQQDLP